MDATDKERDLDWWIDRKTSGWMGGNTVYIYIHTRYM